MAQQSGILTPPLIRTQKSQLTLPLSALRRWENWVRHPACTREWHTLSVIIKEYWSVVGCQCQWCAGFLLDQENQEIIFWPGKPGKKTRRLAHDWEICELQSQDRVRKAVFEVLRPNNFAGGTKIQFLVLLKMFACSAWWKWTVFWPGTPGKFR